jgi:hypothetical protein
MVDAPTGGRSHEQFLLLLDVSGADDETIDANALQIHLEYMAAFGPRGAFTFFLLKLGAANVAGINVPAASQWTHVVRYFGPVESAEWLQNRIATSFSSILPTARMQSFTISDITGRY